MSPSSNTGGTPAEPSGGKTAAGGSSGGSGGTAGAASSAGADSSAGTTSGGGSGGAAGNGGAATDGGAAGSAGGPRCGGLLLCDDFESYPALAAPGGHWTARTQNAGTVLVDTKHAFSGKQAVHFHGRVGPAPQGDAAYIVAQRAGTFPVQSDAVFVRFMMYIERWPNASPMHTRLAWLGTTAMNQNQNGSGYVLETYNGIGVERISAGRDRDTSQRLTDAANTGRWLCWEMEINNTAGPPPGGSRGTVLPRMWREGVPMTLNIAGSAETWSPAQFQLLQLSLFAYQLDTAAADFWIDEVAMNTTRIGCPTQ